MTAATDSSLGAPTGQGDSKAVGTSNVAEAAESTDAAEDTVFALSVTAVATMLVLIVAAVIIRSYGGRKGAARAAASIR